MGLEKSLEVKVEKVLKTNTVTGATKILQSKEGVGLIFAISFLESSLPLPILTDPFLVAAILAERKNTFKLVVATTIASVMGGLFAFLAAAFFFDYLLIWMSEAVTAEFNNLTTTADSGVFILTLVGAVTPIPYTIVAWVVAVVEGSIAVFILASVIGRGFRYAVVGWCTYRFGIMAVAYAKKYIGVTSIIIFILAGLFIWLKM